MIKNLQNLYTIFQVSDLAREYGFKDEDGDIHDSRSLKNILKATGYTWLPHLIPGFVRVPLALMHQAGNKF
jgi:hypothetical protein